MLWGQSRPVKSNKMGSFEIIKYNQIIIWAVGRRQDGAARAPTRFRYHQKIHQPGLPLPQTPPHPPRDTAPAPAPRATPWQVAATMCCGIFAIGARGTWQRGGATVSFRQVVIGAAVTLTVLVSLLSLVAYWAAH